MTQADCRPRRRRAKLVDHGNADLVLIDAVRDGQFIFDVYQNSASRDKIIPLRASKLLYARAAREKYDYQQFVNSPEEIVALFNRYGIRYAVIESEYPTTHYADADPPPRKMLRELLAHDSRFTLVESWPMKCGDPIWDSVKLQLYEYRDCAAHPEENQALNPGNEPRSGIGASLVR